MVEHITYPEGIKRVMQNNGGFAPLKLIYEKIWDYKDIKQINAKTPDKTIQKEVQKNPKFTRIAKGVYALTNFIEDLENRGEGYLAVENDEFVFKNILTERLTQQKARIGQDKFKKRLLKEMKSCPITGITDKRLLIGSHIKPWSHRNDEERLNIKNGLLLSPLFDKLFDKDIGLITFTLDKRILISSEITKENIARLNISNDQEIINLDINGREEFLEYHRKFIFQG